MSSQSKYSHLPDAPGVYFFKDKQGDILYIGRATSLKDRVKSYYSDKLILSRGQLLVEMLEKADKIDFEQTDSVLEAIILESNLIKKYRPYFNTKEKDDKSYSYIVITKEDFPRVFTVRGKDITTLSFETREVFGPYPHGSLLREALKIIRKIFPFRDEKANMSHYEKFYIAIGLSPDLNKDEYEKTIKNLTLFFNGKKKELIKNLEAEMEGYANLQQFEKANEVKKTLYALSHIRDVALIKKDIEEIHTKQGPYRIESYDIAHLSGKNTVGVMTVTEGVNTSPDQYRRFKISKDANNDVAGIKEILKRRFNHPEWRMPDLIVVDGGIAQRNVTIEVLKELNIGVPVVSVVKDDSHKPSYFLGDEDLIKNHKEMILRANSESHRFAITYHKKLRGKTFLAK
jgi:excinuclease ABC subunit C